MRFDRVLFFFLSSFLCLSLISCGIDEEHIRDYVFYVHTNNEALLTTTNDLIDDFNDCSGRSNLFKTTRDKTKYNSSVIFDANLKQMGSRVIGYGTYLRKVSEDNPLNVLKGANPKIYYVYTGEIKLDTEYVKKYLNKDGVTPVEKNSTQYTHLKKLFFHEAGHVIGLGHTDHPSDVMYPTIDDDKNFAEFCTSLKQYLSTND